MPQQAYKFTAEVDANGNVALRVPLPAGTRVEVLILAPDMGDDADLVEAAESSLGFWNYPLDDEDWNEG